MQQFQHPAVPAVMGDVCKAKESFMEFEMEGLNIKPSPPWLNVIVVTSAWHVQ
jgi:hypothetical protein